jgi:hypothetical protein
MFPHHSSNTDVLRRAFRPHGPWQATAFGWLQVSRRNFPPGSRTSWPCLPPTPRSHPGYKQRRPPMHAHLPEHAMRQQPAHRLPGLPRPEPAPGGGKAPGKRGGPSENEAVTRGKVAGVASLSIDSKLPGLRGLPAAYDLEQKTEERRYSQRSTR